MRNRLADSKSESHRKLGLSLGPYSGIGSLDRAAAGMGQVLLNDRNYCLRRANDSIELNNTLVLQGDTLAREGDARSQAESHLAIRTMAIQAAENSPVLEAENLPVVSAVGNDSLHDRTLSELEVGIHGEETVRVADINDAAPSMAGDADLAENVKHSTLEHGGKSTKSRLPYVFWCRPRIGKSRISASRSTSWKSVFATTRKIEGGEVIIYCVSFGSNWFRINHESGSSA